MRVVGPRGDMLRVSNTSHPDLFWALLGSGGGSFGIVVGFTLQLVDVPDNVTLFHSRESMDVKDTSAFFAWAHSAPRELTVGLTYPMVKREFKSAVCR
jgi:FAD/FMN-containing dehydrogenase